LPKSASAFVPDRIAARQTTKPKLGPSSDGRNAGHPGRAGGGIRQVLAAKRCEGFGGTGQDREIGGERAGLLDIGADLGIESAALARGAAMLQGIAITGRSTAAARAGRREDTLSHLQFFQIGIQFPLKRLTARYFRLTWCDKARHAGQSACLILLVLRRRNAANGAGVVVRHRPEVVMHAPLSRAAVRQKPFRFRTFTKQSVVRKKQTPRRLPRKNFYE
jgi:hypothetical protein